MKKKIANMLNPVFVFVKKHSIGTVVVALLITAVIVALAFRDTTEVAPGEDQVSSTVTTSDVSSEDTTDAEDVTSSEETASASEPTESAADNSVPSVSSSKPATTSDNKTSTNGTTSDKKPTSSSNVNSTEDKPRSDVVQAANPETGISWDGKSPIIYTYPDGTTGTEKREGATYEKYPGMTITVVNVPTGESTFNSYNAICEHCGKKSGNDGKDGKCVRWLVDGIVCPDCGESVPANTCHTCK